MERTTNIHVAGFRFPGKMACDGYIWQYPTLNVANVRGGIIATTIYVGIVNSKVDKNLVSQNMNPMMKNRPNPDYNPAFNFSNFARKIDTEYFDHGHIEGIGFYVTEHHLINSLSATDMVNGIPSNTSFGVITFVERGTNLKKSNHTNVFTQAMRNALSEYEKKKREQTNKLSRVVTPMLAEGESLSANDTAIKAYISDIMSRSLLGLYCQPKFDGVRCMMTLNPKYYPNNKITIGFETEDHVICYSRTGKKVHVASHLLDELREILVYFSEHNDSDCMILDGEFYCHGMEFNIISGCARGNEYTDIKKRISIHVYDYYDGKKMPYRFREKFLADNKSLFDYNNSPLALLDNLDDKSGHVVLVDTKHFNEIADVYAYYEQLLDDSYEGMMVRVPNGIYMSKRSPDLVKIKPMISREYVCVGYEFGNGKDSDVPVIVCEVGKNGLVWGNDWRRAKDENIAEAISPTATFKVKIKGMDLDSQRSLGRKFGEICPNGLTHFENFYKGKMVTVEFYSYSIECKPEKGNLVSFN
jgi:hypothetical protein